MKTFTVGDIKKALVNTGIEQGDLLMVHSSLFTLGKIEHCEIKDIPIVFAKILLEYIGDEGTLVAPTFNFDFCEGKTFDHKNTPSKKMGAFSEYIRCLPNTVRSFHPMQSVAAIGKLAKQICSADTPSSFDTKGPFAIMLKNNAKILLLGTPMQSAAFVHYAEERAAVPYRYWKEFSGDYILNNKLQKRTYKMYVKNLDIIKPKLDLSKIEKWLSEANKLNMSELGSGYIKVCNFKDFHDTTIAHLKEDPYCLIKKEDREKLLL